MTDLRLLSNEARVVMALERIAAVLDPVQADIDAALAAERERVLGLMVSASETWRYRNICFDGMDRILTAVVPLATVERALHRALMAKPGTFTMDRVDLHAKPAIGESPREDAG